MNAFLSSAVNWWNFLFSLDMVTLFKLFTNLIHFRLQNKIV